MHAVFITNNRRYFDAASEERQFLLMLSEVLSTLHVVVLTPPGYKIEQVNDHTWLYPTNTYLPGMHYFDALYMVRRQVSWGEQLYADVVLSDDPFVSGWVGLHLASKYACAWILNVRDFYWKRPFRERFLRWPILPLSAVLEGATRICVFSQRARIYLEQAVNEIQKEKLRVLPELLLQPQGAVASIDLKVRYPEFNFVIVACAPSARRTLDVLLGTLALLRVRYPKAGLVLFSAQKDERRIVRRARAYKVQEWVRFVQTQPGMFPFTQASVFLYLHMGEEEDSVCIRAATASCPIIAIQSPISQKVIEDRVNGLFAADTQPSTLSTAIRTFNEMPGWRERFQVNANMHIETSLPTREHTVALLREALTFPYVERPPVPPKPDHELFADITRTPTLKERLLAFWKRNTHLPGSKK